MQSYSRNSPVKPLLTLLSTFNVVNLLDVVGPGFQRRRFICRDTDNETFELELDKSLCIYSYIV